jgi:acyl carrier protein
MTRLRGDKPAISAQTINCEFAITLGDAKLSVEQELEHIFSKWKKNESLVLGKSTKLEDLNIDSLDLVEVMFEIEEKFDVSLAQSHQEARTATLADVTGWIEHQLALKKTAAEPGAPSRTTEAPAPRSPELEDVSQRR